MTGLDLSLIEVRDIGWVLPHVADQYGAIADRRALLAEVKRLRAQVESVRDLHVKDRDGWCQGCSFAHPCQTVRALGNPS